MNTISKYQASIEEAFSFGYVSLHPPMLNTVCCAAVSACSAQWKRVNDVH